MTNSKNQDTDDIQTYGGLNKDTADQFIKTSKWLLSIFIIVQLILISTIYKGERLIAEAKGDVFQLADLLTSASFIAVIITTIMMLVYVFTRIFWYAIIIGLFLCFEAIGDIINKLQDGFSYEDLDVLTSLTLVNAITVLWAAFCMYAIKKIDKQN